MANPLRTASRLLVLIALLTLAPASLLHAQFGFLDRIFGKMDNLSVSGGWVWVNGDGGLYDGATPIGLAVKAGIWAGGTGCINISPAARAAGKCAVDKARQKVLLEKRNRCMLIETGRAHDRKALETLGLKDQPSSEDPTADECARLLGPGRDPVEEEVTVPQPGGGSKTTRATIRKPSDTGNSIKYGVTIGYGQVLGLAGQDDDLDYKGGIEELPSIGLNVVFLSTRVSGSIGGRLGLNRLLGFRAFLPGTATTGTTYAGSSSALFYGAGVGGNLHLSNGAEILVEASYTFRNFKSIEWGISGATIPTGIIRKLPLEAFSVEVGARVKL